MAKCVPLRYCRVAASKIFLSGKKKKKKFNVFLSLSCIQVVSGMASYDEGCVVCVTLILQQNSGEEGKY